MKLEFTKMEGCGNDYVYVNGFTQKVKAEDKSALAVKLSDRHFGIGGDGLIFINPGKTAPFEMEMYNLDGTRGEMCGNGIRCVGKYIYDHGLCEDTNIDVESAGKVKHLVMTPGSDGKIASVRVDMGAPILDPEDIPYKRTESGIQAFGEGPVVSEGVVYDNSIVDITSVSMGNPHCVIFCDKDADLDKMDISHIGPFFESEPHFPKKTNVEFVRVINRNNIEMRVYERGTGETLACGTGCCASVVAGVLNDYTDREVRVRIRGGELLINWDEAKNTVFMTGPATEVFSGTINIY